MTCEHLYKLEVALVSAGIQETSRGQAWGENCREWVYFDCLFTNLEKTMKRFDMDESVVKVHEHLGTHDGQEYGLECENCKDAIMGLHPKYAKRSSRKIVEFE